MKVAFIIGTCVLTFGCTRHQVDSDAKDRITVCGIVQRQDGAPLSKALIEMHKVAKDTSGDAVANSYELAETKDDGSFVLRSADEKRQYWLSIHSERGCEGLSRLELESKRLPVTFLRSATEGNCESKIHLVVSDRCDLKVQYK